MAHKVPVVATDVGRIPEVVVNGEADTALEAAMLILMHGISLSCLKIRT